METAIDRVPQELLQRGFVELHGPGINEISAKYDCGNGLFVLVWKRNWSGFYVQVSYEDSYDGSVTLCDPADLTDALPAIDALIPALRSFASVPSVGA